MDIKISLEKEHFRWGPLDGFPLTLTFPALGVSNYFYEQYQNSWFEGYMLFDGGLGLYVIDTEILLEQSKKCFDELMLDDSVRRQMRVDYDAQIVKLRDIEKRVYVNDFIDFSDEEFLQFWERFYKDVYLFWAFCAAPELATWGAAAEIESEISEIISDKEELLNSVEVLTSPIDLSFYQIAEKWLIEQLLRVDSGIISEEKVIDMYIQRFYWIKNSYASFKRISKEEVLNEIKELRSGDLEKQLEEIDLYKTSLTEKRLQMQKRYGFSDELMKKSFVLGECISWQDERKAEIWRYQDVIDVFLNEAEKRFGFNRQDLLYVIPDHLVSVLEGDAELLEKARSAQKNMGVYFDKDFYELYFNDESQILVDELWDVKVEESKGLKGVVACVGDVGDVIEGEAVVIKTVADFSKMKEGAILVSPMTTPDYMPLIKKAKAIITDEGGVTAHAAVVSRELSIPCIVGTKIATSVLKDGDVVNVDVKSGVVKKL